MQGDFNKEKHKRHPSDQSQKHQININLDESENEMNEEEMVRFQQITRSYSIQSTFKVLLNEPQREERPLFWNGDTGIGGEAKEPVRLFKSQKKERQKKKCDYNKNICGYITKKVIREFVGEIYKEEVRELCAKHRGNYEDVRQYYQSRREYVTGPSHLPDLISARASDSASMRAAKTVFRNFFIWFLRERYLRYLILDGKMNNRKAYIEYKNTHLFKFLTEKEANNFDLPIRTRSSDDHQK